jgi:hypothetical protein
VASARFEEEPVLKYGSYLSVDELPGVFASEVLPRPLDYGFEFGADDCQQRQMDAEPGGECDGADEFVVLLAKFGDGGVAADHGEDAAVRVDEGGDGLAADGGKDIFCAVVSGLLGYSGELGEGLTVAAEGVGQVAYRIDVLEASDAQVRPNVEPSVWMSLRCGLCGNGLGFDTSCPDYQSGWDLRAIGEKNIVGGDFFYGRVETELNAVLFERFSCVGLRGRREGTEDGGSHFDENDLRASGVDVAELPLEDVLQHVAECAGHLDSGWASAYDDEVELAGGRVRGIAICRFEGFEDGRAEFFGVGEGVKGQGEFVGAGDAEEVHAGACCEDEKVSGEAVAGGGLDGAVLEVDRCDFVHLDVDVVVIAEHVAQRECCVAG